jgi:hypothetical protein
MLFAMLWFETLFQLPSLGCAGFLSETPSRPRKRDRSRRRFGSFGARRGTFPDPRSNALRDAGKPEMIVGKVPIDIGN